MGEGFCLMTLVMTFSMHILLGACFLFLHAVWAGICDLAKEKKKGKKLAIATFLNATIGLAQSGSVAMFFKNAAIGPNPIAAIKKRGHRFDLLL